MYLLFVNKKHIKKGIGMQIAKSSPSTLTNVAPDVLKKAVGFLPLKDLSRVSQVDSSFYDAAQDNAVWFQFITPRAQRDVQDHSLNAKDVFRDCSESRVLRYRPVQYFYEIGLKSDPTLIHYIKNGFLLSLAEAMDITHQQHRMISDPSIQSFIGDDLSLFKKVLTVTTNAQHQNLLDLEVQKCIKNGTLSFEEAICLTAEQRRALI